MDEYQRRRYYRERKLIRDAFDERLRRRSERQRRRDAVAAATIPPLGDIVSSENLIRTYYMPERDGGPAPGPDGVTYKDLGHREVCAIMRAVSKEIIEGRYQPSRRRTVKVKKPAGGFRRLSLRSIVNRVVDKAVADALTPYFERIFLPGSHGFRPHRSPWTALLEIERAIVELGYTVFTQDDIRKAFDSVPIRHVVELYRHHIGAEPLVDLIEQILQGHHSEGRPLGIDQGSSLSPLSLNVLLHHVLDVPFSECAANVRWVRYADNLPYLTRSKPEGLAALQQVTVLLRPYGLCLKGQDAPPVDLAKQGHKATVLGLSIYMEEGKVRYGIPRRKWKELREELLGSHKANNPPEMARMVINGWVAVLGPAFESKRYEPVASRIGILASQCGFRELARDWLLSRIQSARDSWLALRKRVSQKNTGRKYGGVMGRRLSEALAAPLAADTTGQLDLSEAVGAVGNTCGAHGSSLLRENQQFRSRTDDVKSVQHH